MTIVTKKIGLARLEKLADFLETKVPVKSFNFAQVFAIGKKKPMVALREGGGCGTVGCAIGWSPAVFPKLVQWESTKPSTSEYDVRRVSVVVLESGTAHYSGVAAELFALDDETADRLFSPNRVQYWGRGTRFSPREGAQPKTVAKHLRAYVKWAREQEAD